jgi:hypothetical protein
LEALAAARGATMVEVIAGFLRQAIEAGEIKPESAGLSVGITLDLDDESGPGPWAVIRTNEGEMPYMSRAEAEFVAEALTAEKSSSPTALNFCTNRFGSWHIEARGTSMQINGTGHSDDKPFIRLIMAPVVARVLATQLQEIAPKLPEHANP